MMQTDPETVKDKYLQRLGTKQEEIKKVESIKIIQACMKCAEDKENNKSEEKKDQSQQKQSTLRGLINKFFAAPFYDEREDKEIERRRMLRDMLSLYPSTGLLQIFRSSN